MLGVSAQRSLYEQELKNASYTNVLFVPWYTRRRPDAVVLREIGNDLEDEAVDNMEMAKFYVSEFNNASKTLARAQQMIVPDSMFDDDVLYSEFLQQTMRLARCVNSMTSGHTSLVRHMAHIQYNATLDGVLELREECVRFDSNMELVHKLEQEYIAVLCDLHSRRTLCEVIPVNSVMMYIVTLLHMCYFEYDSPVVIVVENTSES